MYACITYIGGVRPEDTRFPRALRLGRAARRYGQLAASRGTTMAMGQALLNIERAAHLPHSSARAWAWKTSLSRLLNNLEAQGMIERRADDADRRIVRIHLTAAGKERDRAGPPCALQPWMPSSSTTAPSRIAATQRPRPIPHRRPPGWGDANPDSNAA